MTDTTNKATETIKQIDDLLEKDELTTRSGLKLSFSTLRDAISFINDVDRNMAEMKTKVDVLWNAHKAIMWGLSILGGLILAMIWSLLTGQAHITFAP